MKRLFYLVVTVMALLPAIAMAWMVPDEVLHYNVRFKWGFIDANAGIVELTTRNIPDSNLFKATLSGKSVNILNHYYGASDTIIGTLMSDSVRSVYTQNLLRADGQFAIETVTYPGGNSKDGKVVKHLPNGQVIRERISHYGGGVTVDLLGVFYYIRQIDYTLMKQGDTVKVNVFSGKDAETLSILYNGITSADSLGTTVPAFDITLNFTNNSGNAAASKMNVKISTSSSRIPLIFNGSLKVGHLYGTFRDDRPLDVDSVQTSQPADSTATAPAAAS